ncbi:hypothetical protein NTE_01115 [Candidatus Nitrososphaera evergladensis SR1]|jgi:hypothetical protein|uniref:Uncharacterized protein n=1 Tax=Candidatus Nitrososphaera evergladensis SR1 TaxID=1459636 RepID=A0A075MPQ7_9ARCH|nr:hypothetical protein NTE_01115 [Candidatus Nitrososphaera evergladensis SR1]
MALLKTIATATRIKAPAATGIMNQAREPASVTAVDAKNAVAPAGGCVSLRICIAKIETATEMAIKTYFSPPAKYAACSRATAAPINPDRTCPTTVLRGCASGLS